MAKASLAGVSDSQSEGGVMRFIAPGTEPLLKLPPKSRDL